jgi:nitric oxide reductase NorQ protein
MTTTPPAPAPAPPSAALPAPAAPRTTPTGRLGQGELRRQVAARLAADPAAAHTPGAIARTLGRSAGAVGNALATLAGRGEAERLDGSPVRYRATPATASAVSAAPPAPASPRRTAPLCPPPRRPALPRPRPHRPPRRRPRW